MHRLTRATSHSEYAFTLLEVMISLAILAATLTLVTRSQQASMRAVGRGRQMTIATMLARQMMVEVEDELYEDGFPELDEDDEGDFGDQEHEEFGYRLKIEKVEIPTTINADTLSDAVSGAGEETGEPTGMMSAGASMMGTYFEMFRKVLENSIRRVSLEVFWTEGNKEKSITVVSYFTDPRKVDIAAGGGLPSLGGGGTPGAAPAAPGGSGNNTNAGTP